MDLNLSVSLITPSTRYSKWRMKMISSLKGQGIYDVSILLGKDSYEYENDWINDSDRYFREIGLALSPSLFYLTKSVEYPKDLWTKLDRKFGKHNEDHNKNLEITSNTTRVLYSKFLTSTLSDEFVQDEEEAKSST